MDTETINMEEAKRAMAKLQDIKARRRKAMQKYFKSEKGKTALKRAMKKYHTAQKNVAKEK
jgi:hypothetical protein